jgi:hypothetical protein
MKDISLETIDKDIKELQDKMFYINGEPAPIYEFHRIMIRMQYLVKLRDMILLEDLDLE